MQNIEIEKVTLKDIKVLQAISKKTFSETFSSTNSEENIQMYLEDGFSLVKLNDQVINNQSEFYFDKLDGNVLGYLKLNFGESQTEIKEDRALEIERIYVLKEFHGKKVGQVLYEKAMQLAKDRYVEFVWLGVWEENLRAISFYKKNGFIAFDKHVFKLGNEDQTDIMMKIKLNY